MTVKTNKLLLKDDNTGLVRDIKQDIQDGVGGGASYQMSGASQQIATTTTSAALNLGLSDATMIITASTNNVTPTQTKALGNLVGTSAEFGIFQSTTGKIQFGNFADTNIDTGFSVPPAKTPFTIAMARYSSTKVKAYLNGIADTERTLNSSNFTASVFFRAGVTSVYAWDGSISRALVFNYALTPDKIARYSAGAKLDYEDVGGSMAELVVNGALTNGTSWGVNGNVSLSNNINAISSGSSVSVSTLYQNMATGLTLGKRYRLSFDISAKTNANSATIKISGTELSVNVVSISGVATSVVAAGSRMSLEFTADGTGLRNIISLTFQNMIVGDSITVDNLSLVQLGAVLDLEPENIFTDKWIDASGNGLHGTVSGAIPANTSSDWTTFTPSFVNFTPTTATDKGRWRKLGNNIEVVVQVTCSTTLPSGNIGFNLPFTTDVSGVVNPTTAFPFLSTTFAYDVTGSVARYIGYPVFNTAGIVLFGAANGGDVWTGSSPFTWASTDQLNIHMLIPVK
jgi:hypothetical protein